MEPQHREKKLVRKKMSAREYWVSRNTRTLDVHERAQLYLGRIVVLPVDGRGPEDEIEQRGVVDSLDLRLCPVVADSGLRGRLRDVGCESAGETQGRDGPR